MKYIHTVTTLAAILCLCLTLSSCSQDEEEEGIVAEEMVAEPAPPPEPEPHWADGKITVEVGRFETGRDLKNELVQLNMPRPYDIDNIPMSGKRYTIEVEIISMVEVGITEPATYADIYARYRERGYRPLTPEEAVEFRIQFLDQPPVEDNSRMGYFYVLMDIEVMSSFMRGGWTGFYSMGSTNENGIERLTMGLKTQSTERHRAAQINPLPPHRTAMCFAVVKE